MAFFEEEQKVRNMHLINLVRLKERLLKDELPFADNLIDFLKLMNGAITMLQNDIYDLKAKIGYIVK